MSNSKIQIKVGIVEFSGEGEQDWLASQLDKILAKVPELLTIEPSNLDCTDEPEEKAVKPKPASALKSTNLATWLKDKTAITNQTKKFLATAALMQLGGKDRITTGDVASALKKSNQSRLGNPSDCLNANVKKGFCEKDGTEFFVTTEGLEELGIK